VGSGLLVSGASSLALQMGNCSTNGGVVYYYYSLG